MVNILSSPEVVLFRVQVLSYSSVQGSSPLLVATSTPQAPKPLVVSVATTAPVIVHPTFTNTTAKTTMAGSETNNKKKPRATRKKKDPNAPAGVASAYTLFFRDRQASIKAQNPV